MGILRDQLVKEREQKHQLFLKTQEAFFSAND
jgi:hypothetical protein